MDILSEIAAHARERVQAQKRVLPLRRLQKMSPPGVPAGPFPFETALRREGLSVIAEVKKASPSRGVIAVDFPHVGIARDYEAGGAAAISVLTEPRWFGGDARHLADIAQAVSLPLLRKDFVVDPYMVYEARALGASAILLICALADARALADLINLAHGLGLSALVEARDEEEIVMALEAGARVIGVNNRDLRTFRVDPERAPRLRGLVPADRLFVAESGIGPADGPERLRQAGVDAVLVGEALMRAPDRKAALARLRGLAP